MDDNEPLQDQIDTWSNCLAELDDRLNWQVRQSDMRLGLMQVLESIEKLHQIHLQATACYTSIVLTEEPVDQGQLALITGFLTEDLMERQEAFMEAESILLCQIASQNGLQDYQEVDTGASIDTTPYDQVNQTKIIQLTTAHTKLLKPGH